MTHSLLVHVIQPLVLQAEDLLPLKNSKTR